MSEDMHERDIAATDEMIRNLRASTFRKVAIGASIVTATLFLGSSLLVWTSKQGNDPEVLKEALRRMPPLNVTVTLDPDSKVKLAEGATVTLANPPVPMPPPLPPGNNNDPAIQTSVTVFKTVKYGISEVITGWKFANGAAKKPDSQYCYFKRWQDSGGGTWTLQDIANDGVMAAAPYGVIDQEARFARCQWFNGNLG